MGVIQKIRGLIDQVIATIRGVDREEMPEVIGELARGMAVSKALMDGRRLPETSTPRREPDLAAAPPDPLLLDADVAKILRVSVYKVRTMRKRGELQAVHSGRKVGIRQSVLRKYMEENEK